MAKIRHYATKLKLNFIISEFSHFLNENVKKIPADIHILKDINIKLGTFSLYGVVEDTSEIHPKNKFIHLNKFFN